jgi:hypothetical protein
VGIVALAHPREPTGTRMRQALLISHSNRTTIHRRRASVTRQSAGELADRLPVLLVLDL